MATAILKGVSAGMAGECALYGYDVCAEKAEQLAELTGMHVMDSVDALLAEADYILLAVKPQNIDELLEEIAGSSRKDRVYLCIAAGVTASRIKEALGFDARVVSIMPNTPLLLGVGATAMAHISPVTEEEFATAMKIFGCAGKVCEVPSDKMNEVIALNGSTPAFLYEFARGFLSYGVEQGIPYETALALFCQTMRGAAEMMEHSGQDISTLIEMVSSKGGTTIAGLKAMREHGIEEAIAATCHDCVQRAYELAKNS
jgi:pyrroline-5-carboxylate reductase